MSLVVVPCGTTPDGGPFFCSAVGHRGPSEASWASYPGPYGDGPEGFWWDGRAWCDACLPADAEKAET